MFCSGSPLEQENKINLARLVGQEVDNELLGDWDDNPEVEGDLPAVLYDWIAAGYRQDLYPEWEPAQLMAAYAFFMVWEAEDRIDEMPPEGAEGDDKYNCLGWTRADVIEHGASNLIAALECVHYGQLLIEANIVPDPEKLAYLVNNHKLSMAKKGAESKHAKYTGPDKALVRDCWLEWQRNPDLYRNKVSFDRDMLEKMQAIKDIRTITKWRLELQKEHTPC